MTDKITEQLDATIKEKFAQALECVEWKSTERIVEQLDLIPGFWESVATIEEIKKQWKMQKARQTMRSFKLDGIPLYASIEITSEEGNTERVYKEERELNPEDCRKTTAYHSQRGIHHFKMAKHYAERYERLTDKQIALPFDPKNLPD